MERGGVGIHSLTPPLNFLKVRKVFIYERQNR